MRGFSQVHPGWERKNHVERHGAVPKMCLATARAALVCDRMKKLTLLALVAVIGSFVLAGCQKKEEAPAVPTPPAAPKAP